MAQGNTPTKAANKSESSVAVVRNFYEALAKGDLQAIQDLLDPGVEWRAPESVPWGGTFHGHEGFRDFAKKLFEQPVELRRQVLEYIDVGDQRVVVLLRQMGRPKGGHTEYDVPEAQEWKLRNGKVVDFEGYFDTSTVLRTLQLQPRA